MKFPKLLSINDTVGIVAPSRSASQDEIKWLKKGIVQLKEFGLNVLKGKHILEADTKSKIKAGELNAMFRAKALKAIIALQGGDLANSVLPFLNYELIAKNPKILIGFSDITVLLNAISFKCKFVTFLGPDILWKFARDMSDYEKSEFREILINGRNFIKAASKWIYVSQSKKKPFSGRLWGGNLRCFMKLLGTEYFPDLSDGILLVEEANKSSEWFESSFVQLAQTGNLKKLNGIIIGYNHNFEEKAERSVEKSIINVIADYKLDINVLKISEFGHKCAHSVFPIGAKTWVLPNENQISFTIN